MGRSTLTKTKTIAIATACAATLTLSCGTTDDLTAGRRGYVFLEERADGSTHIAAYFSAAGLGRRSCVSRSVGECLLATCEPSSGVALGRDAMRDAGVLLATHGEARLMVPRAPDGTYDGVLGANLGD